MGVRQGGEYVRRMARDLDYRLPSRSSCWDQIVHAQFLPGDDETVEMLNDHVDSIAGNHVGTEMCQVAHLKARAAAHECGPEWLRKVVDPSEKQWAGRAASSAGRPRIPRTRAVPVYYSQCRCSRNRHMLRRIRGGDDGRR